MRALRRIVSLVMVAALALSMSGCWDYTEPEDMLFVMGMAFDRSPSGRLRNTIEVYSMQGESQKITPKYLEIEGDTFYDTTRNAVKIADEPLYWSHTQVVIVSQDIAKNEMSDLVDMLLRLPEIRDSLILLVSKQATAAEVMKTQSPFGDLTSFDIMGSLKAEKQLEKAPNIQLYEFADAVMDERQSAVLPAVGLGDESGEKVVEVSGAAVFDGPWLQGFLDENDTRSFMMVDFKQNLFDLPLPADPGGKFTSASVEFYMGGVDIVPDFQNDKASVSIYIHGEIIPVEISGASTDPDKFKTVTDAILASTSTAVENSVKAMLLHTQAMNGADVISIGNRLQDKMPEVWRKINGNWRTYYSGMAIDVRSELKLRGTGTLIAPISEGD